MSLRETIQQLVVETIRDVVQRELNTIIRETLLRELDFVLRHDRKATETINGYILESIEERVTRLESSELVQEWLSGLAAELKQAFAPTKLDPDDQPTLYATLKLLDTFSKMLEQRILGQPLTPDVVPGEFHADSKSAT